MKREELIGELSKKKIGVLMGGLSAEREVSLKTGEAVLSSLEKMGLDAVGIDAGRDMCSRVKEEGVAIAFIALHGRYGEDGCVQGALEILDIPYTGSGVTASALAMNKPLTKTVLRAIGVDTPDWVCFDKKSFERGDVKMDMEPPVVVKPASSGSSIGVTICQAGESVEDAIEKALEEDGEIMVEKFVAGSLVTAGILGDRILPPIEIETTTGFYDYAHKYTPGQTKYHMPARLDAGVIEQAGEITMKVHRALGCSGVSRSELIVDADGRLWFLELNTLPGMTKTSLLPMAAKEVGLSFDDLTLEILREALNGVEH